MRLFRERECASKLNFWERREKDVYTHLERERERQRER